MLLVNALVHYAHVLAVSHAVCAACCRSVIIKFMLKFALCSAGSARQQAHLGLQHAAFALVATNKMHLVLARRKPCGMTQGSQDLLSCRLKSAHGLEPYCVKASQWCQV